MSFLKMGNYKNTSTLNNATYKEDIRYSFQKSSKPRIVDFFGLQHLVYYPTPVNISYFWSFGFLSGMCLVVQLITGIILAMHYNCSLDLAFSSVEHIMRDINYGWLIRYMHSNGASMFFLVVYIHIGRGLYYKSYTFENLWVWIFGLVCFVLMMAIGFLGYVLPWGQMSFWGATVITNLFSAIPLIGNHIVTWLWGGFSVGEPTLTRFYALHFLLPFILVAIVLIHIMFVHEVGSNNNSTNFVPIRSYLPFYPYFFLKDFFALNIFLLVFFFFIIYYPNYLGHSDNYIPANPLVTPEHIVPEWYFLPFYAILRSVDSKILGVILMFSAIIIFFLLPFLSKYNSIICKPFSYIYLIVSNLFLNFYTKINLKAFDNTKYNNFLNMLEKLLNYIFSIFVTILPFDYINKSKNSINLETNNNVFKNNLIDSTLNVYDDINNNGYIQLVFSFFTIFLLLGWLGSQEATPIYISAAFSLMVFYFFIIILIPLYDYKKVTL